MGENEIAKKLFSKIPSIKFSKTLGFYTDLYVGHIDQGDYRKKGSSGGFVTWMAVKLLKTGEIDGYIHVRRSNAPGVLFEYGISHTVEEMKSGAKSRYYPVEASRALKEVKKTPGKYAIVGIPEIIAEVRLLAMHDPIINERIKYYFGLVCGHQKTTKYAEAIAWEYGIKPGNLENIDFRVKRNTGTAIEYDMKFTGRIKGKTRTFLVKNNEPFVSSWAHGFFKARFSDFTDNAFNELADVTFGDAWLEEYVSNPMGSNILVVRNKKIAKLIKQGIKSGEVKVDSVDEDKIVRSQLGLVHHTRDELPYRLYKELKKKGWSPRKRALPSNELPRLRKNVQDARQEIAEKSHLYYKEAVQRDDFDWFKQKMRPYVNKYKKLYGQSRIAKPKKVKADGVILTLTGYFNYGNVLQRYALQEFLRRTGRNYVSYVDPYSAPRDLYIVPKGVRLKTPLRALRRYFNYQRPYWYIPTYGELYPEAQNWENIIKFVNKHIWIKPFNPNDRFRNYIVGSDQVWRNWWGDRETLGYYFLNFLRGRKANRVAYAASFGKDDITEVMDSEDVEYVRPYIEQFDGISVREASASRIIRDVWGIKDVHEVIDPTLLLDRSDYSELINRSALKYEKIQPIFAYVLGEAERIDRFVLRLSKEREQSISSIHAHKRSEGGKLPEVEIWLKGFRDAELVVTNSFHGMVFSILNNTEFIVIGRKEGGLSRIRDLLEQYDIKDRLIDEDKLSNFDTAQLRPINWVEVNRRLVHLREMSSKWLISSLE